MGPCITGHSKITSPGDGGGGIPKWWHPFNIMKSIVNPCHTLAMGRCTDDHVVQSFIVSGVGEFWVWYLGNGHVYWWPYSTKFHHVGVRGSSLLYPKCDVRVWQITVEIFFRILNIQSYLITLQIFYIILYYYFRILLYHIIHIIHIIIISSHKSHTSRSFHRCWSFHT